MSGDTSKNGVCMHCGGEVDEHGYALGGDVEETTGEHELNPEEVSDESPQLAEREKLRSFAEALGKGRR